MTDYSTAPELFKLATGGDADDTGEWRDYAVGMITGDVSLEIMWTPHDAILLRAFIPGTDNLGAVCVACAHTAESRAEALREARALVWDVE